MKDLSNLKKRVEKYQEVRNNTAEYRKIWEEELKSTIVDYLREIVQEVGLDATIEVKEQLENLEAIVLSLGETRSGIYEKVNHALERHLIRHNGSLIYQQLFNGKIIVLINYPMIENYGQPHPPKTIAIYRPEELKQPFLLRHLEAFMKDISDWEDYDDDEPTQRIGFNLNFMENQEFSE